MVNETAKNSKLSPSKLHLNMSNITMEQRINDSKESFVRTVLTARQECKQFSTMMREKGEFALT